MPVQIDDNSGQTTQDLVIAAGSALGAAFFIPGMDALVGSAFKGIFKGVKGVAKGVAKTAFNAGKLTGEALRYESGIAGTGIGGSGMGLHHLASKPIQLAGAAGTMASKSLGLDAPKQIFKSLSAFGAHPIRNTAYRLGVHAPLAAARIAVGGAAYGAVGIAKTIVNTNGLALAGLAGAAGVAMASTESPNAGTQIIGGGMVDAMGGTSQYGVRSVMNTMNASGDVVLGAHNRRRG